MANASRADGQLDTLHGTAIALGGRAALVRGPSGSGKSDLALRCIGLATSAIIPAPIMLLADDRVSVSRQGSRLLASCPASIRGRLEVRGLGVIDVESVPTAELTLLVDLTPDLPIDRYPDPLATVTLLGVDVPVLHLHAREASAPYKVALALLENKAAPPK